MASPIGGKAQLMNSSHLFFLKSTRIRAIGARVLTPWMYGLIVALHGRSFPTAKMLNRGQTFVSKDQTSTADGSRASFSLPLALPKQTGRL